MILDLRDLLPNDQNWVNTYSGKLAPPDINGGDFILALEKIESEGIAQFHGGLGNAAGWGTNELKITSINWDRLEKYLKNLKGKRINRKNRNINFLLVQGPDKRKYMVINGVTKYWIPDPETRNSKVYPLSRQ